MEVVARKADCTYYLQARNASELDLWYKVVRGAREQWADARNAAPSFSLGSPLSGGRESSASLSLSPSPISISLIPPPSPARSTSDNHSPSALPPLTPLTPVLLSPSHSSPAAMGSRSFAIENKRGHGHSPSISISGLDLKGEALVPHCRHSQCAGSRTRQHVIHLRDVQRAAPAG